jgi:hypothetical protein
LIVVPFIRVSKQGSMRVEEARSGALSAIPLREPPRVKALFVIWRDSGVSHVPPPPFVSHLLGA